MARLTASILALIAGLFILSACQSLSKDECVAADWRVIGENDGANGRDPESRFRDHVKACERAGVIPDQTLWYQGYNDGLIRYCTPMKGLSEGQAGRTYSNVCPVLSANGFERGYRIGLAENRAKASINSYSSQMSSKEAEIARIETQIDKGKIDRNEGERTIRRIRQDIRDLRRDRERTEFELAQIQRDIDWFTRNPDADIPPRYY